MVCRQIVLLWVSIKFFKEKGDVMLFADRTQAGKQLADELKDYANNKEAIVLGLPRGGLPVAYEISDALNLPLDILLVRKLGVPGFEELAMGAIASGDVEVFNEDVLRSMHITEKQIEFVTKKEKEELQRRSLRYRGDKPYPEIKDKIIILVDDGIATGATMRAGIAALRKMQPKKIIVAVPVASSYTLSEIRPLVDECICLETPEPFEAIGLWYRTFEQLDDSEVIRILNRRLG